MSYCSMKEVAARRVCVTARFLCACFVVRARNHHEIIPSHALPQNADKLTGKIWDTLSPGEWTLREVRLEGNPDLREKLPGFMFQDPTRMTLRVHTPHFHFSLFRPPLVELPTLGCTQSASLSVLPNDAVQSMSTHSPHTDLTTATIAGI